MIARIWTGVVRTDDADEYEDGRSELLTLSIWDSVEAVEGA